MKNELVKLVERNSFIKEYVSLLKGYLELTDRQSQVLSELIDLSLSTSSSILTKHTRRSIIDKTGVGYCNLSTIITLLKMKGVLSKNSEFGWRIVDQYLPQIDNDNRYVLSFILKLE